MLLIPSHTVEAWLLEDINMGDLTTRTLGLAHTPGEMTFRCRSDVCVSGMAAAKAVMARLDLTVVASLNEGDVASAGSILLQVQGPVERLQQGWKVAQNILEWACGVATQTQKMVSTARSINPKVTIACTRKSIPGTRLLATQAILAGGAVIHRAGTAETVLLFANHRHFLADPDDWASHVAMLRAGAPETKIIVEADTLVEAKAAYQAQPDVIQLDKFGFADVAEIKAHCEQGPHAVTLSLAGGINPATVADYAATGINVLVTSSPYYAKPADIGVQLRPLSS
ncbi:MAG: ModD protein [Neisseriaceae bacterium]|nr:ModD protein [Neisseriaceae bacterium]